MRQWTSVSPVDCLHYAEYRCLTLCILFLAACSLLLCLSGSSVRFKLALFNSHLSRFYSNQLCIHLHPRYVPFCYRNFCIVVCFGDFGILLSLLMFLSILHYIISTHCCYWYFDFDFFPSLFLSLFVLYYMCTLFTFQSN